MPRHVLDIRSGGRNQNSGADVNVNRRQFIRNVEEVHSGATWQTEPGQPNPDSVHFGQATTRTRPRQT